MVSEFPIELITADLFPCGRRSELCTPIFPQAHGSEAIHNLKSKIASIV